MSHNHKNQSRGVASVEAVVALPVFVILFVGMFFVRDLTSSRLAADQEVRRCSWEYALNYNCGGTPPGCGNVVGKSHYGSLTPKFDQTLNSLGDTTQYQNSDGFAAVKRILQKFVSDYLAQAVTKRFEAQKTIERERPGLFGGGKSVVSGKYGLACNVPPQGQHDVLTAVWDQFKP